MGPDCSEADCCVGHLQGFEGDALWGSALGVYSAAASAAHQKLAAVFTCISLGESSNSSPYLTGVEPGKVLFKFCMLAPDQCF